MSSLAERRGVHTPSGFTLIEVLVVLAIIAILAAIVIIAINPARQFKQAHDTQRVANVNAILNAIGQNMADNKGVFACGSLLLPTTATDIAKATLDIRSCLAPTYLAELPYDPTIGNNTCTGDCASGSYDTKYTVLEDATTGRVTVAATGEIAPSISVTR